MASHSTEKTWNRRTSPWGPSSDLCPSSRELRLEISEWDPVVYLGQDWTLSLKHVFYLTKFRKKFTETACLFCLIVTHIKIDCFERCLPIIWWSILSCFHYLSAQCITTQHIRSSHIANLTLQPLVRQLNIEKLFDYSLLFVWLYNVGCVGRREHALVLFQTDLFRMWRIPFWVDIGTGEK